MLLCRTVLNSLVPKLAFRARQNFNRWPALQNHPHSPKNILYTTLRRVLQEALNASLSKSQAPLRKKT